MIYTKIIIQDRKEKNVNDYNIRLVKNALYENIPCWLETYSTNNTAKEPYHEERLTLKNIDEVRTIEKILIQETEDLINSL